MLLARASGPRRPSPFKFENFWVKLPRFQEAVQNAWSQPTSHTEPFHRLGHKLFLTARALHTWSKNIISDARLKLHMAQEVVHRFDIAQESRRLSDAKFSLRARLKKQILGWAAIEKALKRQCYRITYL